MKLSSERLHNQQISQHTFESAADVVQWLGAVQSQDYPGAAWALGIRIPGLTQPQVDQAFQDGAILRTHLLRPTWHFVSPQDIRWLLMLTAPRVHQLNGTYYRKSELDEATLRRSHEIITRALEGGKHLTRTELGEALTQAGVNAGDGLRLGYIMMHAELDGLICSGGKRGKQFIYALLEERVPSVKVLTQDEALAELTLRFYASHGPASVKDFSGWSGLTMADVKRGIEMLGSKLLSENIDGQTYWFTEQGNARDEPSPTVHLLPNYDEYISGYTDKSALFDPANSDKMDASRNIVYGHFIMIDGEIVGTWRRVFEKRKVIIESKPFHPLSEAEQRAFAQAADRYGAFLGMDVEIR